MQKKAPNLLSHLELKMRQYLGKMESLYHLLKTVLSSLRNRRKLRSASDLKKKIKFGEKRRNARGWKQKSDRGDVKNR